MNPRKCLPIASRSCDEVKWLAIAHVYFYDMSFRDVARFFFRSHATIGWWWNNFQRYGTPTKQRMSIPKNLGPLELDLLKRMLTDNPTMYLDELVDSVRAVFDVEVSVSTVCRALYFDLGLTRKKITMFNREKSLLLQQQYWSMMKRIDARPHQLVFIDETAKDIRDIARLYGR